MRKRHGHRALAWLAAVLGVTVEAHADDCSWTDITGRIESVSSDPGSSAVVTRASGAHVPALPLLLLCNGDRLDLTGVATVIAIVDRERRTYTAAAGDRTIRGVSQTTFGPPATEGPLAELSGIFRALFATPRAPIPVYVNARGGSPTDPTPDPLLPSGEQDIPQGYPRLALVWRKASGTLDVTPATQPPFSLTSGHSASAVIDAPADGKEFSVSLRGQPLFWSVKYVAGPPAPPGIDPGTVQSPSGRLLRAVWILRSGPVRWHAFALTEVADLARSGSFAADQIWTALRSGELSDAFAARSAARQ